MYVRVFVIPKSKKESFAKTGENRFEACVRERAERNMANKRVVELVASHFNLPAGCVRIISGHQSPYKMLSVDSEAGRPPGV